MHITGQLEYLQRIASLKLGLTGRVRYRTQRRFLREPLMVLQVETKQLAFIPARPFQTDVLTYSFRDATQYDMQLLAIDSSLKE